MNSEMSSSALSARGARLSGLDLAVVGGAAVALAAGFLPWWGGAVDLVGPVSVNGWSSGSTAWVGTILLAAAAVPVGLRRGAGPLTGVGLSVLLAFVSAAGLLLLVVRWLTLSRHVGFGVYVGPKYGIYVALMAGVLEVGAVIAKIGASGLSLALVSD